MKWPKDRRKAFLWAAKAFGTPHDERTERQKELTLNGLCYAIKQLTDSMGIYHWAYDFGGKVGIGSDHWWEIRGLARQPQKNDKERSLFCCLMAALSDKEFEEISG